MRCEISLLVGAPIEARNGGLSGIADCPAPAVRFGAVRTSQPQRLGRVVKSPGIKRCVLRSSLENALNRSMECDDDVHQPEVCAFGCHHAWYCLRCSGGGATSERPRDGLDPSAPSANPRVWKRQLRSSTGSKHDHPILRPKSGTIQSIHILC